MRNDTPASLGPPFKIGVVFGCLGILTIIGPVADRADPVIMIGSLVSGVLLLGLSALCLALCWHSHRHPERANARPTPPQPREGLRHR